MKKTKIIILIIFILLINSVIASPLIIYNLDLNSNKENITLNKLETKIIEIYKETNGNYKAKVISFNNKTLKVLDFDIPSQIFKESFDENATPIGSEILPINNTNFNLQLPYYENGKEIIIYNNKNQEKLKIDISMFSKNKCGNNICDISENYKNCQIDCISGSKDNYCDNINDNKCDPDCKKETNKDCEINDQETNIIIKEFNNNLWLIIISIIILFLIIFIILKRKK